MEDWEVRAVSTPLRGFRTFREKIDIARTNHLKRQQGAPDAYARYLFSSRQSLFHKSFQFVHGRGDFVLFGKIDEAHIEAVEFGGKARAGHAHDAGEFHHVINKFGIGFPGAPGDLGENVEGGLRNGGADALNLVEAAGDEVAPCAQFGQRGEGVAGYRSLQRVPDDDEGSPCARPDGIAPRISSERL